MKEITLVTLQAVGILLDEPADLGPKSAQNATRQCVFATHLRGRNIGCNCVSRRGLTPGSAHNPQVTSGPAGNGRFVTDSDRNLTKFRGFGHENLFRRAPTSDHAR